MTRVARRGPLARAPGALKVETSEIVNIFVAVEGGPLGEKTNFEKKSHNAEKLKGEKTLWGFSTSILSQNINKLKWGKIFSRKKVSHCRKKIERGTLWSRPVWYVTREIRKTFLVQFARPNSAIWCNNIL